MVDYVFFLKMNSYVPLITWKMCCCLECDYAELFQEKMNHTNNQFYRSLRDECESP